MKMPQNKYFFTKFISEETQEWLGLTFADLLCYPCMIFIGIIWVINEPALEWILLLMITIIAVLSCSMGMRSNKNVSGFANFNKLISYPIGFSLIIAIAIVGIFK